MSCNSGKKGCIDRIACNYDKDAIINDGSCYYCFRNNCSRFPKHIRDCNGNCISGKKIEGTCEPLESVVDIDGNRYFTVEIGRQIWMKENLKVTKYRNGDNIMTGFPDNDWANLDTGAYAVYNDDIGNFNIYGNLYNWFAIGDKRGICPEGWHVPSDDEWKELELTLGMCYGCVGSCEEWRSHDGCVDNISRRGRYEASYIKDVKRGLWTTSYSPRNNESGFSALPGGYRYSSNGNFGYLGRYSFFWTSTESSNDGAWYRILSSNHSSIGRYYYYKQYGFSVRCVKN